MTQTDLSFEQALSELQRVVAELESDDGNLEASLARYERGGYRVSGLYPVSRNPDLSVIEVDCVLVNKNGR